MWKLLIAISLGLWIAAFVHIFSFDPTQVAPSEVVETMSEAASE